MSRNDIHHPPSSGADGGASDDDSIPHQFTSADSGLESNRQVSPASPGTESHATESPTSPSSPGRLQQIDGAPEVLVRMNNHSFNREQGYPDNFIKTSKYTWWNFLFLNLLFQFRSVSNIYFLINAIYALVPTVSPFAPIISIGPLIFVVGVGMIKDGWEELQRHRADAKANSQIAHVVRASKKKKDGDSSGSGGGGGTIELVDIESADVQVGDIIMIKSGEEIRADVLLLSSTGVESSAFIETCNLDGETNLKNRKAVEETWCVKDVASALAMDIEVQTTAPSAHLHHWTGVVVVNGKEISVGLDQFLYRSAILKNTEAAWGVVIYAGVDTKMFRNLEERAPKLSNLDIKLNWLIFGVLVIQHVILFLQSGLAVWFDATEAKGRHWYLQSYATMRGGGATFGYRYLSYFILLSYLVPISLFVTIELCKVAQAQLMQWDHSMFEWMHGKWQHCTANTSNLNEQLSQVKFIFSDKTGTLTENVMKYKLGDALGLPIESDNWSTSQSQLGDPRMQRYMRALALCHTVQPFPDEEKGPGAIKYDGESPDELALVETAHLHGYELKDRFVRTIHLHYRAADQTVEWEILATLKFTPDRKMMSIVVRNPETGKIEIYTKGADSFVKDRLDFNACSPHLLATQERLDVMAVAGLRTLMVCYRQVSEQEFAAWNLRFVEAGKALENRSKLVDKVCLELERNLLLVGVTAIEDKLQDKVPETIQFFLDAGVVIWMLTGDKRQTAETIAVTSSLIHPGVDVVEQIDIYHRKPSDPDAPGVVLEQLQTIKRHLDTIDMDYENQKQQRQQDGSATSGGNKKMCVSFVVDGPALSVAMEHHAELFVEVAQRVSSAVCCRLTPLQKAKVVEMFQKKTGETALAIGDGANDVSMIGEGKVGVGIVGLEGAQAALAADYAIPRFKHLRILLAVHGRYSLLRNALCILFSFYKNFLIATTLMLYSFHNGFSGAAVYDGWLLTFYNIVFTSIPPWIVGMFEKDVPEERLLVRPALFRELSRGAYFGTGDLATWFLEAVFHGIFVYYFYYPSIQQNDFDGSGGRTSDLVTVSSALNGMIIALVLFKLAIHIRYWQVLAAGAFVASIIIYFCFIAFNSLVENNDGSTIFYRLDRVMWGEPKYWAYVAFGCFGLTMPDLFITSLRRFAWPSAIDLELAAMEREKQASTEPNQGEEHSSNVARAHATSDAGAAATGDGHHPLQQPQEQPPSSLAVARGEVDHEDGQLQHNGRSPAQTSDFSHTSAGSEGHWDTVMMSSLNSEPRRQPMRQ